MVGEYGPTIFGNIARLGIPSKIQEETENKCLNKQFDL